MNAAYAQTADYYAHNGIYPKPLDNVNGVTLASLGFQEIDVDLTIGSEQNGSLLSVERLYTSAYPGTSIGLGSQINWSSVVVEDYPPSLLITVLLDNRRALFYRGSGNPTPWPTLGVREPLVKGTPYSGTSGYTFHASDGRIMYFYRTNGACPVNAGCSYPAQRMVMPNGSQVRFYYNSGGGLDSIRSSYGYGFRFYSGVGGVSQVTSFTFDCESCVENDRSSVNYNVTATPYPNNPSYNFQLLTSVYRDGHVRSAYTYSPNLMRASRKTGSSQVPDYTNTWVINSGNTNNDIWRYHISTQALPNGGAYSFGNTYAVAGNGVGLTFTTPEGETSTVTSSGNSNLPFIKSLTDPSGQLWVNLTDATGKIVKSIAPEGNSVEYQYDARGNVTRACEISKERADLSCDPAQDLVTTIAFREGPTVVDCIQPRTCNKPTIITDTRGYRRDLSWSDVHGQLLSETRGLDSTGTCTMPGGVCPNITYTYSAFTGFDGASFYLLSSTTEKIDATNVIVRTTGYDPLNHFLPIESVESASGTSLRTCRSYDDVGNLVSTTQPNAGKSSCS